MISAAGASATSVIGGFQPESGWPIRIGTRHQSVEKRSLRSVRAGMRRVCEAADNAVTARLDRTIQHIAVHILAHKGRCLLLGAPAPPVIGRRFALTGRGA